MENLKMRISQGIAPVGLRNLCTETAERVISGRAYTFYRPEEKKLAQDVKTGSFSWFRGLLQVSSDVYVTIWTEKEGLK